MLYSPNQGGRLTKAPARALVLLCLLAHAFVVSATHVHRVSFDSASSNNAHTAVSEEQKTRSTNGGAGHSQCLLCRLQRNFDTDLQESTLSVAAPQAAAVAVQHVDAALYAGRDSIIRRGRAPPLT